ncbi:MAG: putative diguanylate cyclase YegE [Deltaproteobacteria bacterium ADurb.Bin151]|jgi:PAS domain S-box-containing protein|nr:MAG: putative diguanylate cyclase YegE [Deltaproteobacteria bacterium ADurb.Bin151]
MENRAEYQISSSVNEGILEISITGNAIGSVFENMSNEVDAIIKANNSKKVIIDARALKGRLDETEIYRYVRNHHSVIYEIEAAMVDIPENDSYKNAIINAGLRFEWFYDIDAARAWLRTLSEERLRILNDLVDIAPASITVHDFAGRFLYANQKTFDLHGYSRKEFLSLKLQDIDIPTSSELMAARMEVIRQNGEAAFEVAHIRKDGTILPLWVHAKLGKWGNENVLFSIATDMTEQKRREEEIERISRLLAETEAVTRVGGWEYNAATGRITWTDEVYRIHGVGKDYDPNNVTKNISFYSPRDEAVIERNFRRAVETGEPYDLELSFIRASGERIWVRTIGKPVMENGKVVRVTGNIMDITDRKAVAEALKESEEKFRTIVNNLQDVVFRADLNGTITFASPSAAYTLGCSSTEEIIGLKISSDFYFDPNEAQHHLEMLQRCGKVTGQEIMLKRRDNGQPVIVSANIQFFHDNAGNILGIEGVYSDITDRIQAEKEREKLIRELQKALKEVKTLSSLLPICASCKKIRTDEGYWTQIEVYIKDHLDVEFSHGICDDCLKKLYPDLYEKMQHDDKP